MLADFRHGAAHIRVRVQQVVVLLRLPVRERRKLLRNCLEQTDNDANRSGLHVSAELIHGSRILKIVNWYLCIKATKKNMIESMLTGVR